jgi:protease I
VPSSRTLATGRSAISDDEGAIDVANDLDGKTIAFMTANEGVERVELTEPWKAVEEGGGRAVLIAPKDGDVQTFDHLDKAEARTATVTTADAQIDDYDGLVLPGGVANPDQLRTDDAAVRFVQQFMDAGRPVAAICHAPWTLVEAGRVTDRVLTSWPSLQTDITNAGGRWVDEQVQVCDHGPGLLVTSRKPDDLEAFCDTAIRAFAGAAVEPGPA